MSEQHPTILDEMVADVYANKEDGSLTILYAKPFTDELVGLEYNMNTEKLLFKFAHRDRYFGMDLGGDFKPFFKHAATITLLQMNMETKEPVLGLDVPITIID